MLSVKTVQKLSLSVVLITMTLGGIGCEVEKLKMANRTLSQRNETLQGENEQLQVERDLLGKEITQQKDLLAKGDEKIAALEDANQELGNGFRKLKELYDELARKPRGLPPLPEQLNEALVKFAEANPDMAEYDAKNGMVKFKSDLTFPLGSAVVKSEAAAMLAKLVKILNDPGAKEFSIYVAGHTDDVPISRSVRMHPTNWYLSVHRAVGVQEELTKAGLDPKRIAVMGFGESHPIAPNKPGKKGNRQNRRVEIWIVPVGSFLTPEAVK
ncbi:MAG TPA: hypothetical protein ENH84_03815 [Phycisphaerae bacterium]|nr:hypothetical protein [Phycisphaerae bacterium]